MHSSAIRIALAVLLLAHSAAWAQNNPFQRDFDTVPIKATPTLDSGIALDGAKAQSPHSFRFALLFDFNVGTLALRDGNDKLGDLIPYRLDAHLLAAYQLHRRFELAVDMPFTAYQADNFQLLRDNGFPQDGVSSFGLGDLRVLPRINVVDPESWFLGIGVHLIPELRLPTGNGQSFLGDRGVTFAPRVAVERAFGPLRVLANLGYRFRQAGQFLNLYVGNEFVSGAGLIYGLPDIGGLRQTQLHAEMQLSTPTEAPFTFDQAAALKTPWEVLGGIRTKIFGNWGVELDVGRGLGLQSGYGREALRVLFAIRYDRQFSDRDHDGIPDDEDQCPDDPEDKDGFQDEDGCPDPDNDGDGVPDVQDACPMVPGPKEFDGCPDTDKDDIPDNVDKCPEQPGPAENEGCPVEGPLVEIESDRIRLNANIMFETASDRIQTQSYPLLDEVYVVLSKNPDIGPVIVEGHTDNRGSRPYNIDLSQRRSKSVLEYLVRKGIERKRMSAKGFGFDKPVAPNDTVLGRAKNRRVEFRLVQDSAETPAKPKP